MSDGLPGLVLGPASAGLPPAAIGRYRLSGAISYGASPVPWIWLNLGFTGVISFDVTTGVDLQEVDNAVNQAQKEISQRYDFKGSPATIELNRTEGKIALTAENDYKMEALWDVLQTKLIKRSVPVKNLDPGEIKPAGGDSVRREIALKMALDGDTAKKVAAAIKEAKLKKVQAAIQGDQVRVTSPSRDDLQDAINLLRKKDFGVELKFGNYR